MMFGRSAVSQPQSPGIFVPTHALGRSPGLDPESGESLFPQMIRRAVALIHAQLHHRREMHRISLYPYRVGLLGEVDFLSARSKV